MPDDVRLPIRVVVTGEKDFVTPDSGGGPRKKFCDVSSELREHFVGELENVSAHFAATFSAEQPVSAVAKLTLKEQALAKSHRPTGLLYDTCPIIGVGRIGQLLISIRPKGIHRLQERIRTVATKSGEADLSTIEEIRPYTVEDSASGGIDFLRDEIQRTGALKLKLFRHHSSERDDEVKRAFDRLVEDLEIEPPNQLPYSSQVSIYEVRSSDPEIALSLASFVGTESLSKIPTYGLLENAATATRPIRPGEFPTPERGRVYPVIGLIDSGIDPNDSTLSPWVVARHHNYIPSGFENFEHGSFVAGMAIYGSLTNVDPRFPNCPVKIVDVAAIPHDVITEGQLLSVLEEVLPKHPEVRVWNLSLGAQHPPCSDGAFSDLGAALDELQDKYDVTFVIAAGNYQTPPLRGWPPENLGEADRICPPADSTRALTVGSVAHLDRAATRVRSEQPSPFSRRGPGPVFLPKPELVHYGGNCDGQGRYDQSGVLSFDGNGNLAEDIGTSFATPLVSSLLGSIDQSLTTSSRPLARALAIHSALIRSKGVSGGEDLRYRGFGVPGDLTHVISCAQWQATLIFEPELLSGLEFERTPFPIPDALRNNQGKVKGEFFITLSYDPPVDSSFGAEYCRTNVDVSLGTYDVGKDDKRHHRMQIPPEPKDLSRLYEKQLIEHGFKWSPNKVYHRLVPRGIAGDIWRLHVSVTHRAGFHTDIPLTAVVVVTMVDPDGKGRVYDETVALMNQLGWESHNLEVSDQIRLQS